MYPHPQTAISAASSGISNSSGENFYFLLPWELFAKSSCHKLRFNSRSALGVKGSRGPLNPWNGLAPDYPEADVEIPATASPISDLCLCLNCCHGGKGWGCPLYHRATVAGKIALTVTSFLWVLAPGLRVLYKQSKQSFKWSMEWKMFWNGSRGIWIPNFLGDLEPVVRHPWNQKV